MRFAKATRLLCMCLLLCGMASKSFTQNVTFNDSIAIITTKARPERVIQAINFSHVHFAKARDNRINFGLVGSEYNYILLKVNTNQTSEDLYLSIDNTSIDTLSVYRIDNNYKSSLEYRAGNLVPFDPKSEYVWHTIPLLIRNNLSFYLIAMKASQKNINVRYEILHPEQLQQKYELYDRLVFTYIGVVCLIIIIILLALFLFKRVVFAAYLGYIVCAFTWIISHNGYLFPYVYPRMPVINEIVKPVSSLGAGYFLLVVMNLVFSQQLQSQKSHQRLIRTMLTILPFIIAGMFLLLIPGLHYIIRNILLVTWHAALILTLFIVALTPISFIKSGATAKIISTAMFVICTMTIIQLLVNSGLINNFFIEEHGITMGSLMENIIIAFGLFYNLLQERKKREKQVLALELAQADTLKKLITVQDNERKRIAGDLHDNIGPLLAALKINFNRIINSKEGQNGLVQKTEDIIDSSILEIRDIAHNLMPKGITSKGLINALKDYFEGMETVYNKSIIFDHDVQSIFQPDLQINIYRIICELVLNAAKHSNACKINVSLTTGEKMIYVHIFDDGQGFRADKQKNSIGLQSAESRVNYLKGKFSLKSEQGKGTMINIEVPL
ncbi:MAG TPA: sensor histidine kinase [Hanamia sp.]